MIPSSRDSFAPRRLRDRLRSGLIWVCAIGLALAGATIWKGAGAFRERAWGCDPFGYLVMARGFRQAVETRSPPVLDLRAPQLALVARRLTAAGVPGTQWRDIGPHATHYFADTDRWVVQYPPGTGLILAAVGAGRQAEGAIARLERLSVLALLALAGLGLGCARRRQSLRAAALVTLGALMGLDVLRRMGDTSFSVQAGLLPLLAAALAATRAGSRASGVRLWSAGAGAALGAAVACRIPAVLLVPGFVLLLPLSAPAWLAFATGFAITGALPVALYQQIMTGSAMRSTYGAADLVGPTLAAIRMNADFYLGAGVGAVYNWCLAIAFSAFAAGRLRGDRLRDRHGTRLVAAVAALWAVPTLYFLSHSVMVHYYSLPATLAALAAMAGAEVFRARAHEPGPTGTPWEGAIAALPAVAALVWLVSSGFLARRPFRYPTAPFGPDGLIVPAELLAPKAWIASDLLSGSFCYYHAKPAFRLEAAGPAARRAFYDFARRPGERVFFVADGERPAADLADATAAGWAAVPRGSVGGFPYYELKATR